MVYPKKVISNTKLSEEIIPKNLYKKSHDKKVFEFDFQNTEQLNKIILYNSGLLHIEFGEIFNDSNIHGKLIIYLFYNSIIIIPFIKVWKMAYY